jgi:hypothetical protein
LPSIQADAWAAATEPALDPDLRLAALVRSRRAGDRVLVGETSMPFVCDREAAELSALVQLAEATELVLPLVLRSTCVGVIGAPLLARMRS